MIKRNERNKKFHPLISLLAMGLACPVKAQSTGPPSAEQIARLVAVGRVRANIGNSGLRRFLAESASLGELQSHAASYRIIEQVERARSASLTGQIAGLEVALQNGNLPTQERAGLELLVNESQTELQNIPDHRADYNTSTGYAGSLIELGFTAGHRQHFTQGVFLRFSGKGDHPAALTHAARLAPHSDCPL